MPDNEQTVKRYGVAGPHLREWVSGDAVLMDMIAQVVMASDYDDLRKGYRLAHARAEQYAAEVSRLSKRVAELELERDHWLGRVDHLLKHCKDAECSECAEIVCPHGEPLHFHHDGCPVCALDEMRAEKAEQRVSLLADLIRSMPDIMGSYRRLEQILEGKQ